MTKAKAKRLCIEIMKKADKLDSWGRTDGRLKHGIKPSFYVSATKISDFAYSMHEKLK